MLFRYFPTASTKKTTPILHAALAYKTIIINKSAKPEDAKERTKTFGFFLIKNVCFYASF